MNELARRSGLTSSYVSKVLSGKSKAGPKFYQGMARAFGYPLDSIERLDREGVLPLDPDPDHLNDEILAVIEGLPSEARKELLLFAHYLSWRQSQNLPL